MYNCARTAIEQKKPISKPLIRLPIESADDSSSYLLGIRKEFHQRMEIYPEKSQESVIKKKLKAALQTRRLSARAPQLLRPSLPALEPRQDAQPPGSLLYSPQEANFNRLNTALPEPSIKTTRQMDLKINTASHIPNLKSKFQISNSFTQKVPQKSWKTTPSVIVPVKNVSSNSTKGSLKIKIEEPPKTFVNRESDALTSERTVLNCYRQNLSSIISSRLSKNGIPPMLNKFHLNERLRKSIGINLSVPFTSGSQNMCLYGSRDGAEIDSCAPTLNLKPTSLDGIARTSQFDIPVNKSEGPQQSQSLSDDQASVLSGNRASSQSSSRRSHDSQLRSILKQSVADNCHKKSVSFDESRNTVHQIERGERTDLFEMFEGIQIRTLPIIPSDASFLNIYNNC